MGRLLLVISSALLIGFSILFYQTGMKMRSTNLHESSAGIPWAKPSDYDNCLVLEKNKVVRIIGQHRETLSYEKLEQKITREIDQIKAKELKIIFLKETDYQKVTQTFDLMAKLSISDYTLVRALPEK